MRFSGLRVKQSTFSGIKAYGTPNAFTPSIIEKSRTSNLINNISTGPTGQLVKR